jgi:DNA-binding phage protein
MAKRINKKFTDKERKEWEALAQKAEQDKGELMEIGREYKKQHEQLVSSILNELKEAKERKGLSLADLSEKTGFDRASLSRLFNSIGNPTLSTLNRIADAVGKKLVFRLQEKK